MSYDRSSEDLEPKVTDILHLDVDTDPYKPDPEETKDYFHGFSGSPRLVARTGHDRWTKTFYAYGWNQTLVQHEKCYMALEDPGTIGRWCKDLSMNIIEALGHCEWAYFFPIRTCLRDDQSLQKSAAATILLVAVKPASLEWEDGVRIALSCRDIMRKFMIFDVEVEIMEGQYTQHAASTRLEAILNPEYPRTAEIILPLLSHPGYSIAHLEDRPGEGTVGLHIKLGADESSVYGLTCRHVVCSGRAKHESYKPSADDRRYYISGSQGHLGILQTKLDYRLRLDRMDLDWKRGPIEKWDNWYQYHNPKNVSPPTEKDRLQLQTIQASVDYHTSVAQVLEDIENRNERQIGHLAYYPDFSISARQPGYLRDWALVELDVRKFTLPPANTIFLGPSSVGHGSLDPELTLKSKIIVKPMGVSKMGQTTGLTHGTVSGIEAVVRRPCKDGAAEYSWEMLIVPEEGASYFSQPGDSGSAVFNNMGEVVAIVTASNEDDPIQWRGVPDEGSSSPLRVRHFKDQGVAPQDADEPPASETVNIPRGIDITFAAPIQWVLDDIEDFTGQKPRLA
ncbi:hypothetical protein O1611_g4464 [Lasiodiplodia mahajangana]|uniref:Uncharacterized protein n=1 Tax=Lasiodiplodia mahajangana TaxID=1108764 RepID=A0ACC2JP89_9PEZI|nr:hypothetical protein O1611_g4464 [Lasiodiplodia mahajangana]